jgi:NADH-quinone oxidoreductase subunit E
MSVRRLAAEAIQPASFAFTPENRKWAEAKMAEYPPGRQASAVIPILWRAQEQEGWVTRAAIEYVAEMLDMAYIRVLEVATFYTQFLLRPVGRFAHIQVCGTTPCMLRGAEDLIAVCHERINPAPFETNPEGTLSWEEVECLGACVNAPMVLIGKDTYEDLTVERFEKMVEAFGSGRGATVRPGPQVERQFSAAETGATTLLEPATAERIYMPFPPQPVPANAPTPAPAAAPKPAEAKPASSDEPTEPGRKRRLPDEAAPALDEPKAAPKVSEAEAEAERSKANAEANADGEPNRAGRESATGAESPAGKIDAGAAPGKRPPRRVFEEPQGKADDLKLISGIGPALERTLHTIGITTWAQVAALTSTQIEEVEAELRFRGRIARDRWIDQASALARGGVEEYRRVFGKEPR